MVEAVVSAESLVAMVEVVVAAVIVTPIDLPGFGPVAAAVQLAVAAPIRVVSAVVGAVSALGPNLVEAARVGLNPWPTDFVHSGQVVVLDAVEMVAFACRLPLNREALRQS